MEVYEITRSALDELIAYGGVRSCADGHGDYIVVECVPRFGRAPHEIRLDKEFEEEYWAVRSANTREDISLYNAALAGRDWALAFEVWHVVRDIDDDSPMVFYDMSDAVHYCEVATGYDPDIDCGMLADMVTGWRDGRLVLAVDDDAFWECAGLCDMSLLRDRPEDVGDKEGCAGGECVLSVLTPTVDDASGRACIGWACPKGVYPIKAILHLQSGLTEYLWLVTRGADVVGLAEFMTGMNVAGNAVSLDRVERVVR